MSGCCDCACRDCFEIAIGKAGKAMCNECVDAGCDTDGECQAAHAYGTCVHGGCDDCMSKEEQADAHAKAEKEQDK